MADWMHDLEPCAHRPTAPSTWAGWGMVKRLAWRVLKGLAWALGLFLALNLLLVAFFRFVPVPVSALMVQRRLEAWSTGRPYAARHTWVPLEEIAPSLGVAVIAAEDQNFADHFGFDWQAIERAVQHNETSRRKRGASTVSQQTAKNLFLWNSRSWTRKGLEAWCTLLLEAGWSKKRILEVYLNIVEFGDGIYGPRPPPGPSSASPPSASRPARGPSWPPSYPTPGSSGPMRPATTSGAARPGSWGRCASWAATSCSGTWRARQVSRGVRVGPMSRFQTCWFSCWKPDIEWGSPNQEESHEAPRSRGSHRRRRPDRL